MAEQGTRFGSLSDYSPGRVTVIQDDPRNYAYSNVFAVAAAARPYEKVAVAKNAEYVLEVVRAEGRSPWRLARHDEFCLVMDGEAEFRFVQPHDQGLVPSADGSVTLSGRADGSAVGRVRARTGHLVMLPAGLAWEIEPTGTAVLLTQTIEGPETVYRWSEICQTT